MNDYTAADFLFILLVLVLIHGIMLTVGWVRRRKSAAKSSLQEKSG